MTKEKIRDVILNNTKASITFGSPNYIAIDSKSLDIICHELLSDIQLSLQEAYDTGQKDGYDCARIDLGKQ
jgi:hypothetical protein